MPFSIVIKTESVHAWKNYLGFWYTFRYSAYFAVYMQPRMNSRLAQALDSIRDHCLNYRQGGTPDLYSCKQTTMEQTCRDLAPSHVGQQSRLATWLWAATPACHHPISWWTWIESCSPLESAASPFCRLMHSMGLSYILQNPPNCNKTHQTSSYCPDKSSHGQSLDSIHDD